MDYPTVNMIMAKVKDADNAIIEITEDQRVAGDPSRKNANYLKLVNIQKASNCLLEV